jgi:hypothetical protein
MKILIMVLSQDEGIYRDLMQAQMETWGQHSNTVWYCGSGEDVWDVNLFRAKATDNYDQMGDKFLRCLSAVWKDDWDIIFRTNSSSYVIPERLERVCSAWHPYGLYAGWSLETAVSGAGIFLSRDVCKVLLDKMPVGRKIEEDVLIGRTLYPHVLIRDEKSRIDNPVIDSGSYHYRFKWPDHRDTDAGRMRSFIK